MTATAHALIGAAIARAIPDPIIGLPLSFISHLAVDKIPHWDPMTTKSEKTQKLIWTQTIIDVAVGFLSVLLLANWWKVSDPSYLLLSAFVSQLPDWLEAPYVFFKVKVPPFRQIYLVQKWLHDVGFNARLRAPWGVVTQLIVVGLFLFWSLA